MLVSCSISPYFPRSLMSTNVLYVHPPGKPLCRMRFASRKRNSSPPPLQLHPRGNTAKPLRCLFQGLGMFVQFAQNKHGQLSVFAHPYRLLLLENRLQEGGGGGGAHPERRVMSRPARTILPRAWDNLRSILPLWQQSYGRQHRTQYMQLESLKTNTEIRPKTLMPPSVQIGWCAGAWGATGPGRVC